MKLLPLVASIALPLSANAAIISAVTHAGGSNPIDSASAITSLTSGGVVFDYFVPFTTVTGLNGAAPNTSGQFEGVADPAPIPSSAADLVDTLGSSNLANGKANAVAVDMYFTNPLIDTNRAEPNFALFEAGFTNQTDSWTITPIIGGTTAAPTLGTALTFAQNSEFGDTGTDLRFRRNTTESLNQSLLGATFDFADFGLSPSQPVLGLRVETAGGDPALIIGIIPEPSRASLVILGLSGLILRRRR